MEEKEEKEELGREMEREREKYPPLKKSLEQMR